MSLWCCATLTNFLYLRLDLKLSKTFHSIRSLTCGSISQMTALYNTEY
jgi:hypothetical protein